MILGKFLSEGGDGDGDGNGDGDGDVHLGVPEDDIYQAVALPIHLLWINPWCFFLFNRIKERNIILTISRTMSKQEHEI